MIAAVGESFGTAAAVLALAAVVGFVATRLRQPLIVAFISVGILAGPSAFGWVRDAEPLELLAEIGIAVLLFLVGLKLDIDLVRTSGKVALVTGLGQVLFTSVVGFGLSMLLGLSATTALYVAVALTFSSTIIIVKLLSDKRELDEVHGRIALGFLIVQDICVVAAMIVLSSFSGDRGGSVAGQIGLIVAKGAGLVVVMAVLMRFVLPGALRLIARSQELLVVSTVAWAVAVAAVGDWLGFSVEVGAFLAGFAVASTPYRESIASSLSGLRDFLLLFFFIELGAQLELSTIGAQVPTALVLSLFVLVGNPLIVMVIMGLMRYRKRVSFLAGLAVAQISEFSLILISLGRDLGHVDDDAVGLVTMVGLITIGASTYMILYSHPLYERLAKPLSVFERRSDLLADTSDEVDPVDAIVFGYGRFGRQVVHHLARTGHQVLVVDWDPYARPDLGDATTSGWVRVQFGDADDPQFGENLPLRSARWIVSTIPRVDTNRVLATSLRGWGATGRIAVTAHTAADAERLGPDVVSGTVDVVLQPFADAAEDAVEALIRADRERGG